MKLKIIIFFALLVGSVACSQKTCPTYAQEDTPSATVSGEEV